METLNHAIKTLDEHCKETANLIKKKQQEKETLELNIIKSLFESFPSLKSFELDVDEESDPEELCLAAVNSVPCTDEGYFNLPYPCLEQNDNKSKAWLIECNISMEVFQGLSLALSKIDQETLEPTNYEREDYE